MRHFARYAWLLAVALLVRPAAAVDIDGAWSLCLPATGFPYCGQFSGSMMATGNAFTLTIANLCTISGTVDATTGQITVPSGQCPQAGLFSFTGTATDTTFSAMADFALCPTYTVQGVHACPACDDGNACTTDGCGATDCSAPASSCTIAAVPDGQTCDDGIACTHADQCTSGTCGGAPTTCDDGNPCTDDACDPSTGQCTFTPNTAPCDDHSQCTTGDTCSGGACVGGPTVTCDACEACFPLLGCRAAPRLDCRHSLGKSRLLLGDSDDDSRDKVTWSWGAGAATTGGDLGDPAATDAYTLCVFDGPLGNRRLVLDATAPAGGTCTNGGSCWRGKGSPTGSKGWVYKDTQLLLPDGLKRVTLKPGAARRAKANVAGRGSNLNLPSPMNLQLPVVVQLQGGNGACFDATFLSARIDSEDTFSAVNSPSGAFVDAAR
jgi:hypothetical protein